jgi:hypothetical protein
VASPGAGGWVASPGAGACVAGAGACVAGAGAQEATAAPAVNSDANFKNSRLVLAVFLIFPPQVFEQVELVRPESSGKDD